jgi:Flp pilus assembly protein TadB
MFKAIWAAVIGGNPMSLVALGLAVVLALGSAFGAGYYTCAHGAQKASADAVQAATTAQAKADAVQSSKDRAIAVADALKRGAANQKAIDAAAQIKAHTGDILKAAQPKPVNGKCPVPVFPAALLKSLNDPNLIGDGQ